MITKEKINQIQDFIENMPEIQVSLSEMFVDYLNIFVENSNLKIELTRFKNELASSKQHTLELLKELENQDIKIFQTEEELNSLKMFH